MQSVGRSSVLTGGYWCPYPHQGQRSHGSGGKRPRAPLPLKITDVVTAHDALRIFSEAWDLVPKRVVLKAWIKTDILSTQQRQDVEQLLRSCGNKEESAMRPQFGSVTQTEAC